MLSGIIYTETVVFAAPEQYNRDAPYQLAIVDLEDGQRLTIRVLGERAKIGDRVEFVENIAGVAYYRKSDRRP